eukprot:TCONS_00057772-protein
MSMNAGLQLAPPPSSNNIKREMREHIEWDLPYDTDGRDYPDLSNLSLGTEMRNKLWENENKMMLANNNMGIHQSQSSPTLSHLDHNQNQTPEPSNMQYINGLPLSLNNLNKNNSQGVFVQASTENFNTGKFVKGSQSMAGTGLSPTTNLPKQRPRNQPLLQSPMPMSDKSSPDLPHENGFALDPTRLSENQSMKEELLEMKSIFTRLVTKTDDVAGLPEPVQLALKVIKLEGMKQDYEKKIQAHETQAANHQTMLEKEKKDHEFELAALKKENMFLKERIDYKATLEASTKGRMKGKDENSESELVEELKDEIKTLKENLETTTYQAKSKEESLEHQIKSMKCDIESFEKDIKGMHEKMSSEQTKEQQRRAEIDRYIIMEQEALERERQDRYLLLVEQNKLKHKVEKLSESCKSYQMKNEELCRIQNELEQECDQFRKLKKIIQDHGLPNHEQLVVLQQQTEMFKDDVLSERKDRERAQAQRDKLRRDLEILQSRNQSLQEQVYKYQEHIMRLNTGDQRVPQQEIIPQHQGGGNGRFSRQLSNPAYFNPRMRMGGPPSVVNALMKNPISQNANGGNQQNRQPFGEIQSQRNMQNFNGYANTNTSNNNYDWKQQQAQQPQQRNFSPQPSPQQPQIIQQQQTQQQAQRNMFSPASPVGNRMPQSPLLGPNGDPWVMAPSSPNNTNSNNQQQVMSGGGSYNQNIWSQQASPSSPNSFNSSPNPYNARNSPTPSNWQSEGSFTPTSNGASSESNTNTGTTAGGQSKHWSSLNEGANDKNKSLNVLNGSKPQDAPETPAGFQCGKCNTKLPDTDAFRGHAEICFN